MDSYQSQRCAAALPARLRVASVVQYVPVPVVGGYLAFVGYFVCVSGMQLATNVPLASPADFLHLFKLDAIARCALCTSTDVVSSESKKSCASENVPAVLSCHVLLCSGKQCDGMRLLCVVMYGSSAQQLLLGVFYLLGWRLLRHIGPPASTDTMAAHTVQGASCHWHMAAPAPHRPQRAEPRGPACSPAGRHRALLHRPACFRALGGGRTGR